MTESFSSPVVIAGAGPTGLCCALELARHGVRSIVLDARVPRATTKEAAMVASPRAKLTNVRTMEYLRRFGLAEKLRALAPLPRDFPNDIAFVTRLDGFEMLRFRGAFPNRASDGTELSSEPSLQVPQPLLENMLRETARANERIDLRLGHAVTGVRQDAASVTVAVKSSDREYELTAHYLVGSDGAASAVRETLGIAMEGRRAIARNVNIVFRAPDLWSRVKHDRAIHYWIVNRDRPAMMGPLDGGDLWWAIFANVRNETSLSSFDAREAVATLAAGIDLNRVEILDTTLWEAHELIAERYRDGRVLLAGDAAHLHPPGGGHGMNMGIADGVNLAWKLAAVVEGWGGETLIDSYELERRAVHLRVVDSAVHNWKTQTSSFVKDALEDDSDEGASVRRKLAEDLAAAKKQEFFSSGLVLGARYDVSPVIAYDGTPTPVPSVSDYTPEASPGARAPHYRFADGSVIYDRFGLNFTLLCFGKNVDAAAWRAALPNVPLDVVAIDDAGASSLYGAPFVLVRPDLYIAWRGNDAAALRHAADTITGRG